jgi:signal transduction histidine kinase
LPSSLRLHRLLIAAAILVPAVVFVAAALWNRGEVVREAKDTIVRTTAVLDEHARKVFDTVDLLLQRVDDHVRALPPDEIATPETNEFLRGLKEPLEQAVSIWVTDATGKVLAGSQFWDPNVDIAEREFFAAQRDRDRGTYVSAAFTGKATRIPSFAVSRRRTSPDGSFAGTVHVALSPEYFARFYAEAAPPVPHTAAILRADGSILAREPMHEVTERLGPDSPLMRAIAVQPRAGFVRGVSTIDRRERFYAYRQVAAHPMYVALGVETSVVLQRWRRNLTVYGAVAALAALTLLLVSWLALRRAQAEQAALAQLRHENEQRLAAEQRLRQAQKMEAVGQLTGGIAHDFNNLLAVIVGSLEMLQRRLHRGEANVSRYVTSALEGAHRAATLTQRLLAFSRQQALDPKPVDPNELVSGMADLLRRTLGETIVVEVRLAEGLWRTFVDPNELEHAILNLAVNARDAMPEGGRLVIATKNTMLQAGTAGELAPGDYVRISVTDSGTGMPADVAAKAFDPFFTTKREGQGTGLGLSQVYGFVTQSGGHVRIHSEPGRGTSIVIDLPRYAGPAVAEAPIEEPAEVGAGHGETVLVVEDDDRVRRFSVDALRDLGYATLEASNAAGALALIDAHPEIAVLFTDVVMPQTHGRALAEAALRRRPDLKVLFTTGYARDVLRDETGLALLPKPFTVEQLAAKMREVISERPRPAAAAAVRRGAGA